MINPNKAGLVGASLIGGMHLIWLHLVLAHAAQAVIDFIFWAHMLRPNFSVTGFDPVAAVTLLVLTSTSGYVFGYLGGVIWNKLHPQEAFEDADGRGAFRARNGESLTKDGQPSR